jgi:hypothetical protein
VYVPVGIIIFISMLKVNPDTSSVDKTRAGGYMIFAHILFSLSLSFQPFFFLYANNDLSVSRCFGRFLHYFVPCCLGKDDDVVGVGLPDMGSTTNQINLETRNTSGFRGAEEEEGEDAV